MFDVRLHEDVEQGPLLREVGEPVAARRDAHTRRDHGGDGGFVGEGGAAQLADLRADVVLANLLVRWGKESLREMAGVRTGGLGRFCLRPASSWP